MPAKKDNATYVAELLCTNYIALEPYNGSAKKILHRHKLCGHEWFITPNNLLTKLKHCPNCSPNSKKPKEFYETDDHKMMGPFLTIDTPTVYKHTICGFEWETTPHNIQQTTSCPNCAFSMCRFLYYAYFSDFDLYKVGITNNIERRLNEVADKWELIFGFEFRTGYEAYLAEQRILKEMKPFMLNTGALRSGNTETFRL